ncbi:Uncharacterized protein LSUE1_G005096 [Lachnellula suecica]|uniref:Calcineurin-like phosphoesterase domain-containing protein n=1 Tax=Lachnellula suecica TaxID=602035 RepID=A0A8T9C8I8_9HELO|nr:Uncharacterized protein LSUE1_G005096 [Lachnellula suecica]
MAFTEFQIMSDLHLETHHSYDDFRLQQMAPYLALLGDIGHVGDERLFDFLEKQLERYRTVYFLLGNHEPYHLSLTLAKTKVKTFAQKMERLHAKSRVGKFVFLDQTRHDLSERLAILGCTLFSRVTDEQEYAVEARLVDFKDILRWTVDDHNLAHQSDLKWLNEQVAKIDQEEPERTIVIFTHHSPCDDARANNPQHEGSEVKSAFVTDLRDEGCWKSSAVKMWAFGHTHYNCDFKEGITGKRVLTNQKGYRILPQKDFDMEATYRLSM